MNIINLISALRERADEQAVFCTEVLLTVLEFDQFIQELRKIDATLALRARFDNEMMFCGLYIKQI